MAQAAKRSLELSARHAETVKSAIQHWAASGTLSPSQASLLADTIVAQGFDWEKFAKYTLRLAVLCLVVAISSVIFEEWFVRIFKRLVALPPWLRSALTGLIAVGVHYFAHQRTQSLPGQKYANEAVHGIGALLFALAAFQLLEQLKHSFDFAAKSDGESTKEQEDDEKRHEKKKRERLRNNAVQGVTLGLGTIYGSIGVLSRSNFIWSCSMIVLGNFCGGMVGYG
jgi:hypothetical protein